MKYPNLSKFLKSEFDPDKIPDFYIQICSYLEHKFKYFEFMMKIRNLSTDLSAFQKAIIDKAIQDIEDSSFDYKEKRIRIVDRFDEVMGWIECAIINCIEFITKDESRMKRLSEDLPKFFEEIS